MNHQSRSLSRDGENRRTQAIVGVVLGIAMLLTAVSSPASALAEEPGWVPTAKLVPQPVEEDSQTGDSVAVASGVLVVGVPGQSIVHVYRSAASSWVPAATLGPSGPAGGFGQAVAISADGGTVLVGAPLSSRAYVFDLEGGDWIQVAELSPETSQAWDFFGVSVALSDDGSNAVVGAFARDTDVGEDAGAAYLFAQGPDGWDQSARLEIEDPQARDGLGSSVAISADGDRAVVAAGFARDAVFVFEHGENGWSQTAELTRPGEFGASVALSAPGSTLAVGDDDKGIVYIFESQGGLWAESAELSPEDTDPLLIEGQFGDAVSLSADGGTLVVGSPGDDPTPNAGPSPVSHYVSLVSGRSFSGSAYVFDASGEEWTQTTKLAPPDGLPRQQFGSAVTLSASGEAIAVGAPGDDLAPEASEDQGTVYTFSPVLEGEL